MSTGRTDRVVGCPSRRPRRILILTTAREIHDRRTPRSLANQSSQAGPGDWIYEPNGAVHEATHHPEETVYLANVHGAIAFTGEDGQILGISDWRAMKALQGLHG